MSLADVAEQVVSRIGMVVGQVPAALHEPWFCGREREYVLDCIDSGWVSSVGAYVGRFEQALSDLTGAPHAVAVVNGTTALHVALQLVGVERDHEVIVPALTFVATANAVAHCGAVPHFADVSSTTLGLDGAALRAHLREVVEQRDGHPVNRLSGRRISAIVPVHVFGHPVAMDEVLDVAREYSLPVVEDAAESLGSTYCGRHTGTFGRIGVTSFNGNKTITTGGGGALLTADADLARRARHLTTTAKLPHRWEYVHDEVAYNYRMPNLNAALGLAQVEMLPAMLEAKRTLYQRYQVAFSDFAAGGIFAEPPGSRSNYWLQTLVLDADAASARDAVLEATHEAKYMTRPVWRLLHTLPMYQACPCAPLPVAADLERRIINLPSSAQLAS